MNQTLQIESVCQSSKTNFPADAHSFQVAAGVLRGVQRNLHTSVTVPPLRLVVYCVGRETFSTIEAGNPAVYHRRRGLLQFAH
jgi:hypothetical protein